MKTPIFEKFLGKVQEHFPHCADDILKSEWIRPQLISPFVLELPEEVLTTAENFIAKIHASLFEEPLVTKIDPDGKLKEWPKHSSVLNCFDFHYQPDTGLKLIEINTNASLYLTSHLLYEVQGIPQPDENLKNLWSAFQESLDIQTEKPMLIVDSDPEQEGLYFEFLIFQEWLQQMQINTEIIKTTDFPEKGSYSVYNRSTDFFFSEDESKQIKAAYLNNTSRIAPHPADYLRFANKKNLQLLREHLLEQGSSLATVIPESLSFRSFPDSESLWSQRKKYFFKPSQSFGSKGVYSGKGISRKAFDRIFPEDFLAQENCPPEKKIFHWNNEDIELKYDLRFYTYQSKVHHYTARLYQGQATNMKTALGGLAPIQFQH